MKNRFREFYADKVDVAHAAAEPEERELTDLELARRVAFALHRGMKAKREQQEQGAPDTGLGDGTWPTFRKQ